MRQNNGLLEILNGLFRAAQRIARGHGRFHTIRTITFLIAGKPNLPRINPHVG